MARRYDSKTTSFSSEGRLMQVEYAFENVNKSTPTLGILTKEGIFISLNFLGVILAAKKLVLSKLLSKEKMSEKMYMIDDHIICSVCGMASDALVLVEEGRQRCQEYFYTFKESIPVERLVELLSNAIHVPTQYGSSRPYGTSILFAGFDKYGKFQLYCADPSGNYASWKAHVLGKICTRNLIGANNANGISFLKEEYKDDMSLQDGIKLALKTMCKTLDATHPKPEDCI
jgi:20S proteasome subunit alpha 3